MSLPPHNDWSDLAERAVSLDSETHRIQPGLLAPPVVCGSLALPGAGEQLLNGRAFLRALRGRCADGQSIIVGANLAFDFGVLATHDPEALGDIFQCLAEGRVYDVLIAQALDAIANGYMRDGELIDPRTGARLQHPDSGKQVFRYSLAVVTDLVLARKDAKENDFWRQRYALLESIPHEQWPEEARVYPLDDVRNALQVALAQAGHRPRAHERGHDFDGDICIRCGDQASPDGAMDPTCWIRQPLRNLHVMTAQTRAAFALHLASIWGMRTDPERVGPMREEVEAKHEQAMATFVEVGLLRGEDHPECSTNAKDRPGKTRKEVGSEDGRLLARMVAEAYGAHGTCDVCDGRGEVPSEAKSNQRKCRSCGGAGALGYVTVGSPVCPDCAGRGWTPGSKLIGCKACDTTGLDLDTAPSLPRTPTGAVQCSRDALKESGNEVLEEYGDVSENEKLRNTYLPFLEKAVDRPFNMKANVLLASGRTSYEGLIQLLPRGGGIRECFVPRPGYVYCSIDYTGLELATFAQTCLELVGYSRMAEALNAKKDCHTMLAAQMIGREYADIFPLRKKDKTIAGYRQAAKPGNFGYLARMGVPKFVMAQRTATGQETIGPDGRVYKGVRFCLLLGREKECGREKTTQWGKYPHPPICVTCAEIGNDIRNSFMSLWSESEEYWDICGQLADYGGGHLAPGELEVAGWNMVRGGCEFTQIANSFFQGRAAAGAKHALWNVSRECYTDRNSPMYGARPVVFVHDEIFSEIPESIAHEAAARMTEVMIASMREFVPDVLIQAEPALMRRWYKGAEAVYDASGRLIPWEPEERKAA